MVDLTEPICQMIDSSLADVLTFDTSGIELYVTENNPKTFNSLIKRLKAYYKDNPDVDLYRMAYALMPSQAASCPDAKQQYINGHFCYADKFAILTNGLGIIRHIAFLDDAFKEAHPEMPVEKKSDSPDEDKSVGDSSALHPVLADYFALHPQFSLDTFLGDSVFDTIETYGFLKNVMYAMKVLCQKSDIKPLRLSHLSKRFVSRYETSRALSRKRQGRPRKMGLSQSPYGERAVCL